MENDFEPKYAGEWFVEQIKTFKAYINTKIVIISAAYNIAHIAEATGASEFHFSARSKRESDMIFRRSRVSMGGAVVIDEYSRDVTDVEIVRETIDRLQIADSR